MVKGALQTVNLEVLVSKKKKKVAFVEAGKEFIDVLFSFMTMPVGMIIRSLTLDNLLKNEMGCLKNLYNSVKKLDEDFLQTANCKDMLLRPRSAVQIHYSKLKLDLVNSSNNEYFVCDDGACDLVSLYQTANCNCGRPLKYRMKLSENQSSVLQDGGVFVKPTTCIMIDDNFRIEPVSIKHGYKLLEELQLTIESKVERRTANMGRDEVLKLMVCSLGSKTPFSDIFMNNSPESSRNIHEKYVPTRVHQSDNVTHNASDDGPQIPLKLFIDKSNKRVLYAEAGEDFVDLLFSFLTVPLAYFFKQFSSLPFKGSMANLYKNIQDFDDNFFEYAEMKEALVNPKLAPSLAQKNQLIDLEEASNPSYGTLRSKFVVKHFELGSNSNDQEAKSSRGFVKGPSKFMVENNLSVTPLSPSYVITLMRKIKVLEKDIEGLDVTVDKDKASHLLAASLVSSSALADVFISNGQKQEDDEHVKDGDCCCWHPF